jgi:hypothetical protein
MTQHSREYPPTRASAAPILPHGSSLAPPPGVRQVPASRLASGEVLTDLHLTAAVASAHGLGTFRLRRDCGSQARPEVHTPDTRGPAGDPMVRRESDAAV